MRALGGAFVLAVALSGGMARAEPCDPRQWVTRAEQLIESLFGVTASDRGIIAAPDDVDRKMVLVPPGPEGRLRIIKPPHSPLWQ